MGCFETRPGNKLVSNGSKKTSKKFAHSFFDTEHLEKSHDDDSAIFERSGYEYFEDMMEHLKGCVLAGSCHAFDCPNCYFGRKFEEEASDESTRSCYEISPFELRIYRKEAREKSARLTFGTEHLEKYSAVLEEGRLMSPEEYLEESYARDESARSFYGTEHLEWSYGENSGTIEWFD